MFAIDAIARETVVFAAIGFLVGGCDDLAIDIGWIWITLTRRRPALPRTLDAYRQTPPRWIAVFVAAWDESTVIGAMLRSALARFEHEDYRLYVGTYSNDRATIDAVAAVAACDPRVRLVINSRPGPTTKADCLNAVWRALERDEARDGVPVAAVVLHDAEDLVHPGELRVFDALIGRYAVVQLPVLPLVDRGAPLVSGHYADEFADAHSRQMVVRQALGVGLPLAGVGCAIERQMLGRIAAARDGLPFDAGSIVEDYELGLLIATLGGRGVLARVRADGELVAVRAYFPATVPTAVRQKARWMTGIALAGWDRIGWGRALDWRDHWMRMRDRRAPLAVLVLFVAYTAFIAWGVALVAHALAGRAAAAPSAAMLALLHLNGALLAWRLVWRAAATGAAYGWREALWSLPRALVSNYVALLAARSAMTAYVRSLRGTALRWDKTSHVFPGAIERTEPGSER
ncbi:glycosyl transferase family protein [Sphingomonas sp. 10B4]|uniref:glycosyl transferase family protein n=1 Tax=Sphingomonas sp. 10B4 TaxID=3048575 RepID=UPI002AB46EC3|nr:glycosyl transferase family protein [Sphingomonas sp. 10B4]MDY7524043.1 glycosyl transferase family protein [Sphingomonas sp. 10B4]MEB0282210.1 glycosyl transferase family protein [Sphingomonas sp. 10B4]